jgi:glycosyltransferase involved in cell wall biosynthesis
VWNGVEVVKIAIIGHKRIPSREGGIEKGVEMHAIRMVERGHEVHVYNRGNNHVFGEKYDKLKEYKGVKIITIPTTNGKSEIPIYSFLATIRAIIGRYDVISYRASGSCVMIPIARLFGVRTIASIHGIDSKRAKWGKFASFYLRLGEKMAAKYASECLVLSKDMQRYFKEVYNCDSIIFANGSNIGKKAELNFFKQEFDLKKNEYYLSLGRITPEKGIHYLIEAYKKTKIKKKLVIAGGDASNKEYINELKLLAKDDKRIVFTGFVDEEKSNELYSNSYAFILPSDLEGMANTLLEAMSFGNCCLVSNIAENIEVVNNYAVTFKKSNVLDLADKIQYLEANPQIVNNLRENSTTYIVEKYSWDKVVDQLLDIYKGYIYPYEKYFKEVNIE